MVVMAAGGAQMLDVNDTFHIGQRNHQAMRRIFHGGPASLVQKEEIGGQNITHSADRRGLGPRSASRLW